MATVPDTLQEVDKLDPRRFYEYAARQRSLTATGLEGFVYKIIPYRYIGSFAFAIDPLSRFKVASSKITPPNRTISREVKSVLDSSVKMRNQSNSKVYNSIYNYLGITANNSPHVVLVAENPNDYTADSYEFQRPTISVRSDTTIRTRPIGSTQGEFETFKYELFSPPRSFERSYVIKVYSNFGPTLGVQKTFNYNSNLINYGPVSAVLSTDTINALRSSGIAALNAELSRNILSMFKEVMPSSRRFNLTRSVIELKDLPRSIATLKSTAEALLLFSRSIRDPKLFKLLHSFETVVGQVPKEYLSYFFGWRQLYKDISGLLSAPESAAKRINFLSKRSGKETNLRITRKYPLESISDASGWYYPILSSYEDENSNTTMHERTIELRLVINTIVDFPPVDRPTFWRKEFLRQLGVVPTIGDLYELTPWTWLADWFFGAANYIQLMEQINGDNSIINWGMSTAILRGKLTTTHRHSVSSTDTYIVDNVSTSIPKKQWFTHQSVCEYTIRKRINAANAMSQVSVVSEGRYLSDFQKSILGALLAQRAGFHR